MAWLDTELTRQFYAWEERGRGWQVFPAPVVPEPPFRPFEGHGIASLPAIDDGRRATMFSSLIDGVRKRLVPQSDEGVSDFAPDEPEPEWIEASDLTEIQVILPVDAKPSFEMLERFLTSLSLNLETLTFEVLGTSEKTVIQFAVHPQHADYVRRHLQAYFPNAVALLASDSLENVWYEREDSETAIVEFGLAREFMLPLATVPGDVLVGIAAALVELKPDELGLFQVIFQRVRHPWAESMMEAVTDGDGKPFFANRPELVTASQKKISPPLYAAVVRLCARSSEFDCAWDIVREMAASLGALSQPGTNELIPLHNHDYPSVDHAEDVVRRQSRRSGMILNSQELLSLVHLPTPAVQSAKLIRDKGDSKAAPAAVRQGGILLGQNLHAGHVAEVRLSAEQRVRHMHIIGASGTGKSTLLFNLIHQDIESGEGLAVLDPHGDLIEHILGTIPAHRINDVVLLDPSDEDFPIGFNILSAHSELEKTLLASDLSSVFKRLSSSWGDQMHSVLSNAILAFLESSQGGTLSDMRRFLLDTGFREKFLQTVSDPEVVYYWRRAFPQLGGNKSIGPLMTRLEAFLGPKPIRYMVSQRGNRLDFGDIMDTGKIFLTKLPQGQIGKENAYLFGSLLMSKFQQQAMSRQAQAKADRRPFWLYVDEFHHFITPSVAEILTGARKYNLGLILAHQELRQLQQDADVSGAVMSNAGTRIVFRVGDADARTLAEGFVSFEADSLRKLGTGDAICRVDRSDFDFNLTVPLPEEMPDSDQAAATRSKVVASSRAKYATPRAEVQATMAKQFEMFVETEKPAIQEKSRKPEPPVPTAELIPPVVVVPPPEPPVTPAEIPKPAIRSVQVPADMGRGGAQHQSIQQRLKAVAEQLGFRATIEKEVLDGQGSVDLALEKEGCAIACEITVTTTTDHEFGNIKKCIRAGFAKVAVISPKAERLRQIEEAVKASLEPKESARIGYFTPDQFIAWLRDFAPTITAPLSSPPAPTERTIRGYKVRRSAAKLTEEERQAKEEIALKAIAQSMKKPRK
jgi:hypothetical protein